MKKFVAFTMIAMLMLSAFCMTASASEDLSATVTVTIADKGNLAVTADAVTVTDTDNDGVLTINDALYAAHEKNYAGGAAEGYSSYRSDYGYSLSKLWGDTGGSFGYYLNNESCRSLADTVKDGDTLTAYIYSDTTYYSDTYTFFDRTSVSVGAGEELTLNLSGAGYDDNWSLVTVAVENANLTVNGEKTEVITDSQGNATLSIAENGTYVISAVSDTQVLVPAVCIVTVTETADDMTSPETGDNRADLAEIFIALTLIIGTAYVCFIRRQIHEK